MAQLEWSEGRADPRIRDWVMREEITTSSGQAGGEYFGSVDIPLGVKVEAMHLDFATAVSGDSVTILDFGISNDGGLYFPCGSTQTLTVSSSYFSVFEYTGLMDGHTVDSVRFLGDGDSIHSLSGLGSTNRIRVGSAGTTSAVNTSRVVLYTKKVDNTAAATTAGKVRVTVYGTRYIF